MELLINGRSFILINLEINFAAAKIEIFFPGKNMRCFWSYVFSPQILQSRKESGISREDKVGLGLSLLPPATLLAGVGNTGFQERLLVIREINGVARVGLNVVAGV